MATNLYGEFLINKKHCSLNGVKVHPDVRPHLLGHCALQFLASLCFSEVPNNHLRLQWEKAQRHQPICLWELTSCNTFFFVNECFFNIIPINTVLSIYFSYDIECCLICPWIFFANLGSALWIIRNYLQNSTCLSNSSSFKAWTRWDLCGLIPTHLRYSTL